MICPRCERVAICRKKRGVGRVSMMYGGGGMRPRKFFFFFLLDGEVRAVAAGEERFYKRFCWAVLWIRAKVFCVFMSCQFRQSRLLFHRIYHYGHDDKERFMLISESKRSFCAQSDMIY